MTTSATSPAASSGFASPVESALLDVRGVTHAFGNQRVLDNVSLSVTSKEIVALLGPSGCGKSTLLRSVAGFVRPSTGEIHIAGRNVDGLAPGQRNIGIVFQNYALFPHLSVFENVAYGLRARALTKPAIESGTRAALETVRMAGFATRRPRELSGGQQQRVALARALATGPSMILLDEPFAALDKNLRIEMQDEVKRLQRERGLTAILVTHDQEEAMVVADRIAVMQEGRILQIDTPDRIYDRPATLFVNQFVGAANLLPGQVVEHRNDQCCVRLDSGATLWLPRVPAMVPGRAVITSMRPEHMTLYDTPADDRWAVLLLSEAPLGAALRQTLRTDDGTELARLSPRTLGSCFSEARQLYAGLRRPDDANVFAVDLTPRSH